MARRRRKSRRRLLLGLAIVAVVAAGIWMKRDAVTQRLTTIFAGKVEPGGPIAPEARPQNITGELTGTGPVRDGQLGVSANAAVLFRHVEMYQWREHCDAAACQYETAWSAPVDSHKFREPKGHENKAAPFNDAVFFAPGLKIGAYAVDPDLPVAQLHTAEYAVHDANLPPNLAASFSERDGVLYAGGDPSHPAVGEVRVSYRVIPAGPATLNGVLRGGKLVSH